ncbi:MAG TPA: glycoside hydrolase family 38 C-terminal domain-containing protein [Candidatus Binataceae bacterium]|nr:glycoside hydrolase family 38 C-terminal domain-containing protein [Candidatus Binataceae bacterium]
MDQLYFVVHTHWDREWYQPFQQMRARLVAMADRMIALVESGEIPFFHFDGQTIVLDDYLEVRPAMASRLRALIRAGKIQVGPWYVLADSFLVSGESLIRNLEIGIETARRFGRPLDVGYLPDQFGHIAQLPQILAGFGFRTAVLWRGVGADVGANRFVWEAPDGSALETVYLPFGYSNGANLPLDSVESFVTRANEIAARERAFAGGGTILVMTGTDHTEPDPRLAARIREARETSSLSFELGPLEGFVNRADAPPPNGLARHRGELRSPLRAHLLPGVTSARTWIKQRDFANCYALERLADPLAALASALGGDSRHREFLELAWRIELQNHPHDSICGCSVDHVHTDMRYRFDQAAIIAENAVRAAAAEIHERGDLPGAAIAVFNPTFTRQALVTGEIELPDPAANYVVRGADGAAIPIAAEVARAARAFEIELGAAEFKAMAAALSHPTLMGRTVNGYELKQTGADRVELALTMSRAATSELNLEEFRDVIRTRIPDHARVLIRATNVARCAISFVADNLTPAGLSFFRLERGALPQPQAPAAPRDSIENEFYRIRPASNGIEIEDLRGARRLALHFEDDGDRGDEYNFDPVAGAAAITAPAKISSRVVEDGPARKRISVSLEFAIPAALAPGRAARDGRTEPLGIELHAALYPGLDRVDCEATVNNRSRDHRLRVALVTPVAASESIADTSFAILRRARAPAQPAGIEDVYPTAPHRTFTAVESGDFTAALISRGIYETEVRAEPAGSTILLTLIRAVGWLSRSDLATRRGGAGPELETPGAQELGEHRFEFAIAAARGSLLDGAIIQRAASYAAPPRMFPARRSFAIAPGLVACDNPRIAFSTARPGPRVGSYRARVFSTSAETERAQFSFPDATRARVVDLAGNPAARAGKRRRRGGALELELRPFEIVTFEVARRKRPR